MRLLALEPQFLRHEIHTDTWQRIVGPPETWHERGEPLEDVTGPRDHHVYVDTLAEAQGVTFLCPKCFLANGGPKGTHSIVCWAPVVPQTVDPKPGRWELVGTGFADLTLRAGSSSVLLTDAAGCRAHFFVTNGEIRMC